MVVGIEVQMENFEPFNTSKSPGHLHKIDGAVNHFGCMDLDGGAATD
jgi:hypothetical protein